MGNLDGKVALITGAARGQGRSHALRLAEAGADIIALDLCAPIESVPYPLANPDDLSETVAAVQKLGRRISARQADVRDREAVTKAVVAGRTEIGAIDIVIANAGIAPMSLAASPHEWNDVIDVNLSGTYHTVSAVLPDMVERDKGGNIVLVSSTAGLSGVGGNSPGGLGYTASKHGIVGLMRAWANYLAPHGIRVNAIHPTGVRTAMVVNDAVAEYYAAQEGSSMMNALPVDLIEPFDVSNAVAWLVSDEARYVTGISLPVDAGFTNKR